MNEDMYKLITTSNHVSNGKFFYLTKLLATRGKALSILQNVSKKRGPAMNPAESDPVDSNLLNSSVSTGISASTGLFSQ